MASFAEGNGAVIALNPSRHAYKIMRGQLVIALAFFYRSLREELSTCWFCSTQAQELPGFQSSQSGRNCHSLTVPS